MNVQNQDITALNERDVLAEQISLSGGRKIARGVLMALALFALSYAFIASQRSWIAPKEFAKEGIYWAQVIIIGVCILALVLHRYITSTTLDWKGFFKSAWPLLLFVVVDLAFLAFGILHRHDPGYARYYPIVWWLNYGLTLCADVAAFLLGLLTRPWRNKTQAIYLVVLFSSLTALVLCEWAASIGFANPVNDFLTYVNTHFDKAWKWRPEVEGFRAVVFFRTPMLLGFTSLVGTAWALALKENRILRSIVVIECLVLVYFSGARNMFIVLGLLFLVALICQIKDKGIAGWIKIGLPIVLAVGLIAGTSFWLISGYKAADTETGISGRIEAMNRIDEEPVPQSTTKNTSTTTSQKKSKKVPAIDVALAKDPVAQTTWFKKYDQLSTYRLSLWLKSWRTIEKHPLGTAMPSSMSINASHSHNDFFSFLLSIGWLFGSPQSKRHPWDYIWRLFVLQPVFSTEYLSRIPCCTPFSLRLA